MIYYNETKSQPIFIIGNGHNHSYVCSQRFMTCPPHEEEPTTWRGRLSVERLLRAVPSQEEPWGAIPGLTRLEVTLWRECKHETLLYRINSISILRKLKKSN